MLRNSFLLLRGIGPQRERTLWTRGITDWKEFMGEATVRGISDGMKHIMDDELRTAERMLNRFETGYFATHLRNRDQWRCLNDFSSQVVFLDIETTGLSLRSPITMVGIYDGARVHSLIRGMGLTRDNLEAILGKAGMIVTYNGASFDLPVIESQFPGVIPEIPHVDLRYPLRRLGYAGGLKRIEADLGIERDKRVAYMTGENAVYLWKLWEKHGKRNALDLLVEYNTEDCRNLKTLAEHVYMSLKRQTFDAVMGRWKG
ncbi:MAG: ribonuclease H-like domain-containing protein [Thermoplasmatota archaeon]|nr:ribonuclease H-like domain-containing protein [Candidatus Thermoplasmatota archaeon]